MRNLILRWLYKKARRDRLYLRLRSIGIPAEAESEAALIEAAKELRESGGPVFLLTDPTYETTEEKS